ncbi:hypothetical protein [Pseudomonas sp. microsymbiont 2]
MAVVGIAFVLINTVFVLALPVSFVAQWRMQGRQASHAPGVAARLRMLRQAATVSDWMALLIFASFTVFVSCALTIEFLQCPPAPWIAYALLLAVSLGGLLLCWQDQGIRSELKKYRAVLLLAVGLISAAIPYLAGPLADATISQFTGLEANAFPRGQNLFVLIVSVIVWPLGLLPLGALVSWFLVYGPKWTKQHKALSARLGYLSPRERPLEGCRLWLAHFRRASLLLALNFTTIGVLHTASQLVSTTYASQKLKQALVFSSFHLPPEACGLEHQVSKDATLVQIRFKLAVVAVPDGDEDYRFIRLPCRISEVPTHAP